MDKCGLCQQVTNKLNNVHNNDIKCLAQMVLNLKGFENSLNVLDSLIVCGNCKQGLENLATFWDTIPDAKLRNIINADLLAEGQRQKQFVLSDPELGSSVSKQHLPVITDNKGQNVCKSSPKNGVINSKRIKPPRKRKSAVETSPTVEILQKRLRHRPIRFENFSLYSPNKSVPHNGNDTEDSNFLKDLPEIATLRSNDGQDIGKLVEIDKVGISSRMRILCLICCKDFRIEKEFRTHATTHNNIHQFEAIEKYAKNYKFHCKLCNKSFLKRFAVRRHFKYVHSTERSLKCRYCETSFKYKFNLDYHKANKHVHVKRFGCIFCKKKFLKRYELQIHIRTHTKERPYKCERCSFSFSHRSNLKTHQKKCKKNTNPTAVNSSNNVEESDICVEKFEPFTFIPPQILLENKVKNDIKSPYMSNFEDFIRQKNEIKINFSEVENSSEYISENETRKLISSNDSNSLSLLETHETCKANLEAQPKLSAFKLDSSLPKFVPPQKILGIKKLSNSFQSSFASSNCPENYTFSDNENSNSFKLEEITNQDNYSLCNNATADDSSGWESENIRNNLKSIIIYEPSQTTYNENSDLHLQLAKNDNFSKILKLPQSAEILNSSTTPNLGVSTFSDIENSNPFVIEEITSNYSYNQDNYSLCDKATENGSQCLETDIFTNDIIYEPSQTNCIENTDLPSKQIANDNFCDILKSPQPSEITNSSSLNLETSNSEVSSGPQPSVELNKFENKFKTAESSLNIKSNNESPKTNNSQSWKVVKVLSKPVKIKDILNLKKSPTNSSTINTDVSNETADKSSTKVVKDYTNFVVVPQQTNINPLTDMLQGAGCSSSTATLKYTNISQQSLLKPQQQIPSLSLTTLNKSQIILPEKPLITKMEILPPLKPLQIPEKALIRAPVNLIKPPTECKNQCTYCYKYFKQKSSLTRHMRTHTGENLYKCNLCPKSYVDASTYNKHKMVHKNAAEALNISTTTTTNAVPNSPTYSTVSDPDPDGIEVMQTIAKFECSSTDEDDIYGDDDSLSPSTMESRMWHNVLDNALMNNEIRGNVTKNLQGIGNTFLSQYMQQLANKKFK